MVSRRTARHTGVAAAQAQPAGPPAVERNAPPGGLPASPAAAAHSPGGNGAEPAATSLTAQLAAITTGWNPRQMVELYQQLVALRKEASAAEDLAKQRCRALETLMLQMMDNLGEDGFQANGQVCYSYTLTTWPMDDPGAFRHYCISTDQLELANFVPNKEACEAFIEKYDGKPDGATRNEFRKFGMRAV